MQGIEDEKSSGSHHHHRTQQPTMTIIRSGRKLTIMHETTLSVCRKRIRVCVRKVKYDVLYTTEQSKFCWY